MSTNAAVASGTASAVIPQWSLGDRLRKIRRITGLSQAEFATRLGENTKTYAAWELDTTAPRNVVAVAKRIEIASGVPAAWVLGVDMPPPPGQPVNTQEYGSRIPGAVCDLPLVTRLPVRRPSRGHAATAVPSPAASQTCGVGDAA